jgi:hypothetical protein
VRVVADALQDGNLLPHELDRGRILSLHATACLHQRHRLRSICALVQAGSELGVQHLAVSDACSGWPLKGHWLTKTTMHLPSDCWRGSQAELFRTALLLTGHRCWPPSGLEVGGSPHS